MSQASVRRRTPLIAWFLGFGILNSLALALFSVLHPESSVPFCLMPTLILYGGNPSYTPHGFDLVLCFLILYGVPFIIYGLLGVILGLIVRLTMSFRSPD
ncbi:MAG: hypothetical protein ABSD43_06220 [Terracidiphilus sp.]|jgi:hypothetical protein